MAKCLDTEPGSRYSVRSAVGCTVSTPSGGVLCCVMPGVLATFEASTYVTVFSDEAAAVELVSSGVPGGAGGNIIPLSRALAAAAEAGNARDQAVEARAVADEARRDATQAKEDAEAAQQGATQAKADAEAAQQGATKAKADAEAAQQGATQAKVDAEAAQQGAAQAKTDAAGEHAAADAAAADASAHKTAAEDARTQAQAAQTKAEQEASKATEAAAAAQAPESIAAQAARPATMLLVRDELLSILGDASLFDLDTDGQKIIVHTDRLEDELLAQVTDMLARFVPGFIEVVQYNHNMEISWRDINKYAECVTVDDVVSVNSDYMYDVPSDGRWVYPLTSLKSAYDGVRDWGLSGLFSDYRKIYSDSPLRFIDLNLPVCTSANYLLYENRTVKEVSLSMPALRKVSNLLGGKAVEKVKLYLPEVTTVGFGTEGNPLSGLTDLEVFWPKLNTQSGNFLQSAKLNKKSAIHVLESLPTWTTGTHNATIGIHRDHKTDDAVLAAIADAEAKGWTLSVQWNPDGGSYVTPATTYGLRKPPIYAKVAEYERPDGTTERVLDWGHYVTDPTGYEEFSSVEEAREHYGLPDESLTE